MLNLIKSTTASSFGERAVLYKSPYLSATPILRKHAKELFYYKLNNLSDRFAEFDMTLYHLYADAWLVNGGGTGKNYLSLFAQSGYLRMDITWWDIKALTTLPGNEDYYNPLYDLAFIAGIGKLCHRRHFSTKIPFTRDEFVITNSELTFDPSFYLAESFVEGDTNKPTLHSIHDALLSGRYFTIESTSLDSWLTQIVQNKQDGYYDASTTKSLQEKLGRRLNIFCNGYLIEELLDAKHIPGLHRNSKGEIGTGYEYGSDFTYTSPEGIVSTIEIKSYKTDDDLCTDEKLQETFGTKNKFHKSKYVLCLARHVKLTAFDVQAKYILLKNIEGIYKQVYPLGEEAADIKDVILNLPFRNEIKDLFTYRAPDKPLYYIYAL